jgi:hypothetical protein
MNDPIAHVRAAREDREERGRAFKARIQTGALTPEDRERITAARREAQRRADRQGSTFVVFLNAEGTLIEREAHLTPPTCFIVGDAVAPKKGSRR